MDDTGGNGKTMTILSLSKKHVSLGIVPKCTVCLTEQMRYVTNLIYFMYV